MEQNKFITWVKSINIDDNWMNADFYRPEVVKIEEKFISNKNLNVLKLNKIADVNRVTGFEVEKYLRIVEKGIPYLRVKNVNECHLDFNDMQFIPIDVHMKFNKSKFKAKDIALTITGRVGTAAIIQENMECNACQDVVKISLKENSNLDPYYLTGYLNTRYNYKLLNRLNSGGSRPRTLINNVREVSIPIPSFKIQRYIGNKVRVAEELRKEGLKFKYEADKALYEELKLEELDQRLKENTKKYSWTKCEKLSDRFDAEFYKSEFLLNNEHIESLKMKGMVIKRLKDIIANKSGSYGVLPSSCDYGKGDVKLLRSTNLKDFLISFEDVINVTDNYYKDKVKVKKDDIILEIKGQCSSGGIVEDNYNKIIINGSIFKFSVNEEYNNYYVLGYLLSKSGQLQKKQNLANSIISYLSIDCINNLQIPIVSKNMQDIIGEKYKSFVMNHKKSKQMIDEAKQDIEDFIEGNFDMSKIKETN